MRLKGRHENLLEALLVARARRVGVEREHFTPAIDYRELGDHPFELGNQVGGDEHLPAPWIAILVRADHGPDELAADDRIESRGRLVEDEQFGLGADCDDERELRALAFREVTRLLPRIEAELLEERALRLAVPRRPKRREVPKGVADRHPRIERDVVWDVGNARLDGDFLARGIHPEDPHLSARWPEQVQQALVGRRLSGAIPAEKPVAPACRYRKAQSVNGVGATVAADQVADFDHG